jgi:hypothetical protein
LVVPVTEIAFGAVPRTAPAAGLLEDKEFASAWFGARASAAQMSKSAPEILAVRRFNVIATPFTCDRLEVILSSL